MDQRRFFLFLTLSMAVLFGWQFLIGPILFPDMHRRVAQEGEAKDGDAALDGNVAWDGDKEADDRAIAAEENESASEAGPTTTPVDKADEPDQPAKSLDRPKLAVYPREEIVLGSLDDQSGYFVQVTLTTQGAAISQIALNDKRYTDIENPDLPLNVVTTTVDETETTRRTLQTSIPAIDEQLKEFKTNLNDINWKVIKTTTDPSNRRIKTSVEFSRVSPDGTLEVVKRFGLKRVDDEHVASTKVRDSNPHGYEIEFDLTIKNRSDVRTSVHYVMQGPTSLPLENAENTRKFRDIKIGYVDGDTIDTVTMTSDEIAKKAADDDLKEQWKQEFDDGSGTKRAFKFVGVDVQYFTTLLLPEGDQLKDHYIDVVKPQFVRRGRESAHSDISLSITSRELRLPPGGELSHHYILYAGPKRRTLLEPLGIAEAIDFYAIPGLGWVSKPISYGMLWIMNVFHDWGFPYGIAIILLTVLVRGAMYPISRKQAAGAKKMKELQPKITELKKKFANDKEKLAKAQMELFSKANYNPLSGCLPLFLQLPIFIGLYQALYNAVDLRMAPFLWISNLAAPDALFNMGFSLPFLGSDFNLLPLVTVCLWIVQQKMFMPPATDDQTAMQQKMMTYMMVFMGFLFYTMPAGLCVYFITSTLWGMAERKLLDFGKTPDAKASSPELSETKKHDKNQEKKEDNFWGRLSAKITAATEMQQQAVKDSNGKAKSSRSSRKKKKQSR